MAAITGITYGASEDWLRWVPGRGVAVAADLAAAMHGDIQVQAALQRAIVGFDRTVDGRPGVWGAGLWVPDPGSHEPLADLVVRAVDPDDGLRVSPEDYLALATHPPRRSGVKVLDVGAAEAVLPAGPAVLQVAEEVYRGSRIVHTLLRWVIFPPGTEQLVALDFRTDHSAMFDALSLETNTITDSLVVEVADR